MIRAVIFDMDGVLIDTEKWLNKYWCQAANEAGYPMKREDALAIRSLAGKYAAPYLKGVFGESFDYEAIRSRRKELMEQHIAKHGVEKKPGVDEALHLLKERGIVTAVATATDEERTKRYLTEIGVYHLFDEIVCATMVENGKPEPDIYRYVCERLGMKPSECLAVEDSPNGILSAYRAGLAVVMAPDLTEPDEELLPMLRGVVRQLPDVADFLVSVQP